MRKTLLAVAAVGAMSLSAGVGLVACSGGPGTPAASSTARPSPGALAEGLTIIDAKPEWGVNAAFKQGGRVVYFESRVGPLKPQLYREQFPNEPQYEMDARFVDAKGGTFILQVGGDVMMDPAWAKDIATSSTHPADRDLDFQAARSAAGALATNLPKEFAEHIVHAKNLTLTLPSERPELQAKAATITKLLPTEAAYDSSCQYNWWEGDLYYKTIYFVANHSATIEWNYSNCTSSWDEEVVNCNHGTCATDSSMSYTCYSNPSVGWVGGYTDVNSLSYEHSTSIGSVTGSCNSGYNWDTPPGHECNEDSAFQLNEVKSASRNTSYGGTSNFNWTDGNGHNYACNCGSGQCSGDWKHPACP